jgi:hypothetical protein
MYLRHVNEGFKYCQINTYLHVYNIYSYLIIILLIGCREQSYDNYSNMRGKYKDAQFSSS